ncbi:hypothetical protein [Raineyella sp.]|uniref:hypothetical protein n=1 Tax=Raineyella sp. TaxID=1911550 RepID=UPI002B20E797|nr:hypothetical protein [Raineyella sp.]MEA5155120.1 hypothetical protein [Raineyella sp.]
MAEPTGLVDDHRERLAEFVAYTDAPVVGHVDVEGLEEGPVELAPRFRGGVAVEVVGFGAECGCLLRQLHAGLQLDVDLVRVLLDGPRLELDVAQELLQLVRGAEAVHESLEQSVFSLVELDELLLEVGLELLRGG